FLSVYFTVTLFVLYQFTVDGIPVASPDSLTFSKRDSLILIAVDLPKIPSFELDIDVDEIKDKAFDIIETIPSYDEIEDKAFDIVETTPSYDEIKDKASDMIETLPSYDEIKEKVSDASNKLKQKVNEAKENLPSSSKIKEKLSEAYNFATEHAVISAAGIAVTITATAKFTFFYILSNIGFTSNGIAASSCASAWMSSYLGYVPLGSNFSALQSIGATASLGPISGFAFGESTSITSAMGNSIENTNHVVLTITETNIFKKQEMTDDKYSRRRHKHHKNSTSSSQRASASKEQEYYDYS
ncbi:678_t:CDS:2, partial [Ambispora gerdemannii]